MMQTLKWLLPRLPLPMLALAASYGVYKFALLFVPHWVAVVQAAAFELTYIGLATIEARGKIEQRKATFISLGAVIVSVLYNSLAGYFHRNGLATINDYGEVILAILHGAPLAIVAYLVADLLLHTNQESAETEISILQEGESEVQELQIEIPVPPALPSLVDDLQEDAKEVQEAEALKWKHEDRWQGIMQKMATVQAELQKEELALQEAENDLQKPDGVSPAAWQAWQAVQNGKSQSEVAENIGKSVSTVSRYCSKVEEALQAA